MKSIVRAAGQIMLHAQTIKDDIESKEGSANFVTKYDIEVQQFLYKELSKIYPDAVFVGEEDETKESAKGDFCFIIDPIDGTTNFIFGYQHSAISVGLMHDGQMEVGIVYNPYLDEMFYAEKGKGAFLNEKALKVQNLSLREGIVSVGTCPYYREKAEETFQIARKLYDHALDLRRSGSAALDICYVAANRTVLYYEMLLSPWDYAAASLILMEAGGIITTMEKEDISYSNPISVIAATPAAHAEYYQLS